MICDMISFLTIHKNILLFLGLVVGGETALIPAVYLAFTGVFDFYHIVPIAILATLISDTLWYVLGRFFPKDTVLSCRWLRKNRRKAERFSKYFENHSLKFLFFSKFVYGTRMAAQVLCGVHKISLGQYILVNTAGVVALTMALALLAPLVTTSVDVFIDTVYTLQISFAVFIFISLGLSIFFNRFAFKKSSIKK